MSEALTLREKVGQLFMIRPEQLDTRLTPQQAHKDNKTSVKTVNPVMLETMSNYPAGGFIIFAKNIADPKQLRTFTHQLRETNPVTPVIAVDEEGGQISRLANSPSLKLRKYPNSEAIAKSGQLKQVAEYIASYLRDYGFTMDFAPVADINTNPANIVIGTRAYGSNPEYVSRCVSEYLDGLHSHGIMGSIKHFPGHGDTKGDTHKQSVTLSKTWPELLSAEIIPFKNNLAKTDSVMIAHITLDNVTSDELPATLSRELVTGKLRNELGYNGVVITDGMMMGAISDNYSSSEAAVLAIEAGCDIILMPWDYRQAFEGVVEAVKSGRLSEARIDESITRINRMKERNNMRSENTLKWWQKTVVYQVYPKSFQDTTGSGTGDIRGIIKHLDYLQGLGVGAVWLTPVYPSPMIDNGYDIADYTGIDPSFGTMEDFDELVSEAGKRGIKIVMDLVFNHTSNMHRWFQESKSSRDNAKADWYIWRDAVDGHAPTNWRSIFGGSSWTWCEERGQYYLHTFAVEQPDLNWENPDVRKALYDSAKFWLDKGVGGFRVDAITYIKKPAQFLDGEPDSKEGTVNIHNMTANTPGILDFLHEFRREVRDGRDIFTVGEANGVSAEELPQWVGKDGVFDMLFEFSNVTLPFGEAEIWCRPVKWTLKDLKRALSDSQKSTAVNGWYPAFFENHDQPRSVNHFFPEGADGKKAAKCLAAVLLTTRGTPFIYQGEELGMTNRNWKNIDEIDDVQTRGQYDLALKEGFTPEEAMTFIRYFTRDNARTPMQWNANENAGFTSGKSWQPLNENYTDINAESEEADVSSVLNWYKALTELRRNDDVLTLGSYEEVMSDSDEVLGFVREHEGRKLVTLVNFSNVAVKVPEEFSGMRILLSSEGVSEEAELNALEARIYAE